MKITVTCYESVRLLVDMCGIENYAVKVTPKHHEYLEKINEYEVEIYENNEQLLAQYIEKEERK